MSDSTNPLDELAAKVQNAKQGGNASDVMAPIEKFADQLIDTKGYPDLTPDVRVQLRNDILQRIDDFIAAKSIAALSDENVLVFEKMLQDGKPEDEVQKFLAEHILDYQNFVTNTLLEFQGVYLGTIPVPQAHEEKGSEDAEVPPPPPPAPVKN